jgi:hypothetical protein
MRALQQRAHVAVRHLLACGDRHRSLSELGGRSPHAAVPRLAGPPRPTLADPSRLLGPAQPAGRQPRRPRPEAAGRGDRAAGRGPAEPSGRCTAAADRGRRDLLSKPPARLTAPQRWNAELRASGAACVEPRKSAHSCRLEKVGSQVLSLRQGPSEIRKSRSSARNSLLVCERLRMGDLRRRPRAHAFPGLPAASVSFHLNWRSLGQLEEAPCFQRAGKLFQIYPSKRASPDRESCKHGSRPLQPRVIAQAVAVRP